jgi:transcriptional regulator
MYNPPAFAVRDIGALHCMVRSHNFAVVAAIMEGRVHFAYAPTLLVPGGERGHIQFHLARANPLAQLGDGAELALSFVGPHAYVSPNWYTHTNQVPTWNYVAGDAGGPIRRLHDQELVDHLAALSAQEEAAAGSVESWSPARIEPSRMAGLLNAIIGFEVALTFLEGKMKLSQNKSADDAEGVIAGLERRADAASLATANAMKKYRR